MVNKCGKHNFENYNKLTQTSGENLFLCNLNSCILLTSFFYYYYYRYTCGGKPCTQQAMSILVYTLQDRIIIIVWTKWFDQERKIERDIYFNYKVDACEIQ